MGSIYAYFTIFESVNAHIKEKVAKWWPFTFRRHYGLLTAGRSRGIIEVERYVVVAGRSRVGRGIGLTFFSNYALFFAEKYIFICVCAIFVVPL